MQTRDTILQLVERKASTCEDLYKTKNQLAYLYRHGPTVLLDDMGEVRITNWALNQLLMRNNINISFFKRCTPGLQQRIFKEFNRPGKQDRKLLIRTEEGCIRAVLASTYGIIDDTDLMPLVFEQLGNKFEVTRFGRDREVTYMVLSLPHISTTYETTQVRASITVINSEVGCSAVKIVPTVVVDGMEILGYEVLQKNGFNPRIIHRGQLVPEKVAQTLRQAESLSQLGIAGLVATGFEKVAPREVELILDDIDALPVSCRQAALDEIRPHMTISKLDAMRHIYDAIKDLPLFQELNVKRQLGDKLLQVFQPFEDRIATILAEEL